MEKMLVTSIFSISNNVFKSFFRQGHENMWLFGKGLHKLNETFKPI